MYNISMVVPKRRVLFVCCILALFSFVGYLIIRAHYLEDNSSTHHKNDLNDNIKTKDKLPSFEPRSQHHLEKDNTKYSTQSTPPPSPPPSPPLYHPSHLVTIPHSTVKGYSAYIDDRTKFDGPSIYLLGIQLKDKWQTPVYGKVIYSSGSSTCLGPSKPKLCCGFDCNRYIHYTRYDTLYHIFQLPLNKSNLSDLPNTIHLSHTQSCTELSEGIQIYNYRPKKKVDFGVCIESPLYGNIAQRLAQFIEMNRILGAGRITVYSMVKDLDKQRLLQPYQTEHLLDIIPWPKDFKKLHPVHYYGEVLAIHDCLYRHMNSVEHLVFVDLDELIIPRESDSWKEMIESIKKKNLDVQSYWFLNTYFLDEPSNSKKNHSSSCDEVEYFTKMYRADCKYAPGRRSKYIVEPTAVNSLDIHAIPMYNKIKTYTVPYSVGSMFHFRKNVTKDCDNRTLLFDNVMLKFEQKYLARNPKTCKSNRNNR